VELVGRDIICLASASWDAMWVNAQHLMHRLAADNRILYVNNLGLRAPTATGADLAKIRARLGGWFAGTVPVERNLWVLSPVTLPLHNLAPVRAFNRSSLARSLRSHADALGFKNPLLWTFLPLGVEMIGRLDESLVVYHCVDDYAANPGVPVKQLREMEERLLAQADFVITTNPVLYEERKAKAAHIRYFGNVADTTHFAPQPAPKTPAALADLPGPLIGYHGNVSGYKTDLPLLTELARANPAWQIVLVGPVGWGDPQTDTSELETLSNVHFIGRVAFEDLPAYVAAFDVGLLPLHDNDSTRRSFPMKFYEFMAAGKPIVARDLPAFADYRDRPELCRLATDATGFTAAIRAALHDDEGLVRERIAHAGEHSWAVRAPQIASAVAERLAAKGA
jgi:glycosyltransferase involved in cell wall biosynthesis